MNFFSKRKIVSTTVFLSALCSAHLHAQSFFPKTRVLFEVNKLSTNLVQTKRINEMVKEQVLVQKLDRTVEFCLAPEQEDGWVHEEKGDYFQMPKEEKINFIKDQILGINKTAETVVENCLKSKPRTYEAFVEEMKSCSGKHPDLSSLFNNVITQNGEENKKNLYPVVSNGNRCYMRNIYKFVLEDREVESGRYAELQVNISFTKPPMLLSFEEDSIALDINHNLVNGFFLTPVESNLNNYTVVQSSSAKGILSMKFMPAKRNLSHLSNRLFPRVFCSAKNNRIQIHGDDMSRMREILSTDANAELRASYIQVGGLFNSESGSWGYSTFKKAEVDKGVWFKPITAFKSQASKKIKLVLSVGNSSYFTNDSKIERIVTCE